jgi:2-polyprenyl-3-methyl-5-hydroxy-6-metoxy-1,4-benzoquinol methylase
MSIDKNDRCPICESPDTFVFFDLPSVPVNVCIQWPTRQQALACPKGDVKLAFCRACGFIWNTTFDSKRLDYSQNYENSLFYSKVFQDYTNTLAQHLIGRYGIRNKTVVDIGCGKGDFLFLLCELGNNRGIGFDTSYEDAGADRPAAERITIIRDFYSDKYAQHKGDLICSRYVFEHVEQPKGFLDMLRRAIDGNHEAIVYFEVPNVSLILRDLSVWDIIYEHCSYFGACSLECAFASSGFKVLDLYESYQGQFLGIEASPATVQGSTTGHAERGLEEMNREVAGFVDQMAKQMESWKRNVTHLEAEHKRVVLWGAGAKGVSFLNMLKIKDQIPYAVDINPRKWGKFIAGTGQKIVSPQFLKGYNPDVIILANKIYEDEVRRTVNGLGVHPAFM